MTGPPVRRGTSWVDDMWGGIRSIGLEALVVVLLSLIALIIAWAVLTVV